MAKYFADYHAWLKIADTALPQNLVGYTIQLCLNPLRADPFTITPYDDPQEITKCGVGTKSFLGEPLPERSGERPEVCKWMAPSRQVAQLTSDDMHKLLAQAIDELVVLHSTRVVVRTSVLEKAGNALLIADSIKTPHAIAKATKREIAHAHTGVGSGDYSLHLCLSPADCKEVITKKWGERMTLAGSLMPQEYLIIYTPRTEEEVKAVKSIVDAAIGFMTGVGGLEG